MAEVVLEKLVCKFGPITAVDSIDLEIPDGSFTILLGPSGCGKTTTLNMIAGLENVTSGDIFFDRKHVQHLPADKRNISMVFQSYALYPNRTVLQNICFPLRMHKVSKRNAIGQATTVAEKLQIEHLLSRKPRQLSGGQQQRVALARSIVRDPAVFLLDEPLSNLDAKLRNDTRVQLKEIQQDLGGTFLLVTHDQAEAMSLADLLVVMNEGRIQQAGSPLDVYRNPINRFVGSFVGVPSMNQVKGEVVDSVFLAAGWQVELQGDFPSGPATLGVRAEDVRLMPAHESANGKIRVVERLGADTIAVVSMEHGEITARLDAESEVQVDQRVRVATVPARTHLFTLFGNEERIDSVNGLESLAPYSPTHERTRLVS